MQEWNANNISHCTVLELELDKVMHSLKHQLRKWRLREEEVLFI